jgi:hypothetical protein
VALVTIEKSVGRGGSNLPLDVVAIGVALVAVGVDRGGVFAPPLSIEGLGQAIELFQRTQRLPKADGKVDKGGSTQRRLNELLNPGVLPTPPPGPATPGDGKVRTLQGVSGLAASVSANTWTPVEASLANDMVFQWSGVAGSGRIFYFELNEKVVPKWFGVLLPNGVTGFDKVNIFFHPTASQAGFDDGRYFTPGAFTGIFHYLSDDFGAQFCAAGNGRAMIMPLMTTGAAASCGVFPQRWESIINQISALLGSVSTVNDVVVSSFSSGIAYSHQFRHRAGLGRRLTAVIDLDGIISSFGGLSSAISGPAGHIVRVQQTGASPSTLAPLAAKNIFAVPRPRWGGPFANVFSTNPKTALLQIHGSIPQRMMFVASRRAG